MAVSSFNWSLSQARSFPCYAHDDSAILTKLHNLSTASHALLWPAIAAVVSALLLLLTWRIAGCRVWREATEVAPHTPTNAATSLA